MYKEERDVLKMRKSDECDMDKFGTLRYPQAAKQEGDKISELFLCSILPSMEKTQLSAQMLEVCLD